MLRLDEVLETWHNKTKGEMTEEISELSSPQLETQNREILRGCVKFTPTDALGIEVWMNEVRKKK